MSHSHGGMDMDGMDMDTSTGTGAFKPTNMALARTYWYLIAGCVGLVAAIRVVNHIEVRSRLRKCQRDSTESPSRPTGFFFPAWATATAIVRELSYPQLHVPFNHLTWLTPPSLGRILILLIYWAVLIYMMTHGAIKKDVYFWERVAYRNAWVALTQVPFIYLLSAKISPLTILTGLSHERINWLHRWVARTMFVAATLHGFYFWTEWARAEFIEISLEVMPFTKYGLGAWGVMLWTLVTSFYPLRSKAYEFFVLQHIASSIAIIWLLHMHVPQYGLYNVWMMIAIWAFDRVARWAILLRQNIRFKPNRSRCKGMKRIGHEAQANTVGENTTVLTIKDVHFRWSPGQHLYLWIPGFAPLEAHPYTIACAHQVADACICNSVQLVIRRHKGFSRRLYDAAAKAEASNGPSLNLTAFVTGPFGNPPRCDIYEILVLISASTGASFTLPILESALRRHAAGNKQDNGQKMCLRRIDFILTARRGEEIGFYVQRLREAVVQSRRVGIDLRVHIAITSPKEIASTSPTSVVIALPSPSPSPTPSSDSESQTSIKEKQALISTTALERSQTQEKSEASPSGPCCQTSKDTPADLLTADSALIREYTCRVDIPALIRDPVESAAGETSVVVCGGRSLVAQVRNSVAALSDERGVHKGTGAQGIHLYVEEYGF